MPQSEESLHKCKHKTQEQHKSKWTEFFVRNVCLNQNQSKSLTLFQLFLLFIWSSSLSSIYRKVKEISQWTNTTFVHSFRQIYNSIHDVSSFFCVWMVSFRFLRDFSSLMWKRFFFSSIRYANESGLIAFFRGMCSTNIIFKETFSTVVDCDWKLENIFVHDFSRKQRNHIPRKWVDRPKVSKREIETIVCYTG